MEKEVRAQMRLRDHQCIFPPPGKKKYRLISPPAYINNPRDRVGNDTERKGERREDDSSPFLVLIRIFVSRALLLTLSQKEKGE